MEKWFIWNCLGADSLHYHALSWMKSCCVSRSDDSLNNVHGKNTIFESFLTFLASELRVTDLHGCAKFQCEFGCSASFLFLRAPFCRQAGDQTLCMYKTVQFIYIQPLVARWSAVAVSSESRCTTLCFSAFRWAENLYIWLGFYHVSETGIVVTGFVHSCDAVM